MTDGIATFSFPTTIYFGLGSTKRLPLSLEEIGILKPLVVTDRGVEMAGILDTATRILTEAKRSYAVFSEVEPNPSEQNIESGVSAYQKNSCDGIVALGGGSPIDAAKAIALLAANEGPLTRYDIATGGNRDISDGLPSVIAIPTTAGTGSEVGRCSVITSQQLKRKFLVCHPLLMPAVAILDPELTVNLPATLTAATGMDALTHSIEALAVKQYHPMCDGIAIKAVELIAENLEKAVQNPKDIEARGHMMMAACMGAVAFQKDLGATHSLAHALSSICDIQHGLANAICLPAVMHYNVRESARDYKRVATAFGIRVDGLPDEEAAESAIKGIQNLNRRIGIPSSLKDLGVGHEQLSELARNAFKDGCHLTNPRACNESDLYRLLEEVY